MADDQVAYVKIDGMPGPVKGEGIDGTFAVPSFVFSYYNSTGFAGKGEGRAERAPLSFTLPAGSNAGKLFQQLCEGTKIKTINITKYTRREKKDQKYFEAIFTECTVANLGFSQNGQAVMCDLTLAYAKAQVISYMADGPTGADFTWDFAAETGAKAS
ncbi:MAG: hypothetical protein EHM45_11125 [Desulfobacteraceae bacterium]|nr:MAG: hypothetical protein EHM45_11125 [Desulfobacteraceae bacterium]